MLSTILCVAQQYPGYGLYNKVPTSIFNITGGLIRFLNNTAINCDGAFYLKCTII